MNQFQKSTKQEWLDKVKTDLKGKAIEELYWDLNPDLLISPFSDISDLQYSGVVQRNQSDNSWFSIEPIWLTDDLHQGNAQIMRALEGGMNGLRMHVTEELTADQFSILLKDVYLEMLYLDFELGSKVDLTQFVDHLEQYTGSKGYTLKQLNLSLYSPQALENQKSAFHDSNIRMYTVNGLRYYKGKSEVSQELGNILFETNQLIENAVQSEINRIYSSLHFKLAVDDCYFLNIAAIRALKHLIRQLFTAYEYSPDADPFISAVFTTEATVDDINYNRIKVSSAALSAVIAGADTVQIFNPNMESTEPEEFRRKICRNVFHLLTRESYMDRVIDPATGSYYIESLTNQVAEAAWTYFQNKWSV